MMPTQMPTVPMPTRRAVLVGAALALAALPATEALAHTPYRQWVVYRRKHLLIGAHRGDERTYALAKEIAAAMAHELPGARARVARGPRPQRIASLMGTGQLSLAVLVAPEAERMARGAAPFEGHRPVPLHALATLGDGYRLYATPELRPDHAWLVAEALEHGGIGRPPAGDALPPHPGASAFWAGEAMP